MVAPLRAKCIALRRTRLTPLIRAPLSARPGAFPDVARVNRNVPAVLVYGCQATDELQNQGAGEIMSATAPVLQSVLLPEQYSIPAHCGFVNCSRC